MTTEERSGRPRVVVGVDGSAPALDAVRWAAEDAVRHGLPLRLVHACATPPLRHHRSTAVASDSLDLLIDRGRQFLREAVAFAVHVCPGLETEQDLRVGQPAEVLLDAAAGARMLVTGSRGLGGFRDLLLGSVSSAVSDHATCPVVVVRSPALGGPPRWDGPVVVGVDGTPASEAAVAVAFEEASLRGAVLVAVHTWSDVAFSGMWMTLPLIVDWDVVAAEEAHLLDERMAGWQEKYPDVEVRRVVRRDRPVRALLDVAQDAALLVVGSRGHHDYAGLGLGSTSRALLHSACCPVAVVRPHH
ncbi:universal stress protein [Actinokineospora sp. PR83]|uniref:universal stress protein n=1 Tax=Actinokineospora sp. PR83 TaxID=2884908 RepID=UPI001F45D2A6|nr:universal stress protein [Actinokineospora sp. PR83]MCG8917487.1 universal stress protein [Actinokineospora sp. PR83]